MRRIYSFMSVLSLDVVAGACIGTLFIARVIGVELSPRPIILLALSVWLIYTLDHLMDAVKISHPANSKRHRFHQKYFGVLAALCIVVFIFEIILSLGLPKNTLIAGLVLVLITGMYFFMVQKRNPVLPKEMLSGLIYTAGIFTAPMTKLNELPDWPVLIFFLQFLIITWMNLLLFAFIEHKLDKKDGQGSIVARLGKQKIKHIINIIYISFAGSIIFSFFLHLVPVIYLVFLIVMASILYLIFIRRHYFRNRERYRIIGDAVFILPLALLRW